VLVRAASILGIPVIVSEQYPKGLGHTVSKIKEVLPENALILDKTAFGCLGDNGIKAALAKVKRTQVLVCGLETHVCVNQTVHQLLDEGYEVHLATDALASREASNKSVGLRKMEQAGAIPSCVEMALFEWMGHSKHADFKELQGLIK
jgi:nicotinamidase-related amidase